MGSYRALARAGARTPDLVATSRGLSALAVTWADGRALALGDDSRHWREAGRALARLHDGGSGPLPYSDPGSETSHLRRAGQQIALLLPDISAEVLELSTATARALERLPRDEVVVHGDFCADQLVIGRDDRAVLIDLDSAALGASAHDLGCLAASTLIAGEAVGDRQRAQEDVAAFLEGYDTVRRCPDAAAMAVHTVAFRLRKAIDPFRACHPDWRALVRARVAATCAALDEVRSPGARR